MGHFSVPLGTTRSVLLLKVAWLPTPVHRRLGGAVESEDGEIPFARNSREPVAGLTLGCFGPEVEVRAAIGVLHRLVARTERRERLAIGETRNVLRPVKRGGPEAGGRGGVGE